MEQELIIPSTQSLAEPETKSLLVQAMEDVGLDERYIARNLKHVIENAVTETKKGDIIEDFGTKLSAMQAWYKFQKDTPDVQIQIANIFQTGTNIL